MTSPFAPRPGSAPPSGAPATWPAYTPPPAAAAPASDSRLVGAQPILERRSDGIWSRAEKLRDDLEIAFEAASHGAGFDAMVIKSGPFVHPAWVKFECWIPSTTEPGITERASGVVTIVAREYHRFEFEYHVAIDDRGRKKTYGPLKRFDVNDANALVRHLVRSGPRPGYRALMLRTNPYQLWRPRNKVNALATDWRMLAALAAGLVGMMLLPAAAGAERAGAVLLGLLLVLAASASLVVLVRRPVAVRSPGRPLAEPRDLFLVDSWQVVIAGLGDDERLLRNQLFELLRVPPMNNFRHWVEQSWNWGLDGKEEREQIVITLSRAMLFCQIHRYSNELYVGWDAYLNRGQWAERTIRTGIDKQTGALTHINTVVHGQQPLSDYDVSDANCLIEWFHTKLVHLVKRQMEARKIEQEVDFRILRGERQGLTKPAAAAAGGQPAAGQGLRSLAQRLRRTG